MEPFLLRACLENSFQVAQATRLCRPATRRTERKQRFEVMRTAFSQRGSVKFRSAGRRPGRASRPRHPFSKHALRKANDDRRLSIGASQARHKDCRASRPLISMAKVESGPKRFSRQACPTGTLSTEWCPLKGLRRVKGNFHARI